ncbi:hypothetical protein [Escherichia coli]|uniref:hypothetical protein n=1 Tax=Escherichia coli TaxID=562 RepID=UPI00339C810E
MKYTTAAWDALYSKRADLVYGAPHAVPSSEGIISEPVGQIEWIVSPLHPLAVKRNPLENSELRHYPAVCIRDTSVNFPPMQAWLLEGQKPIFVPDFGRGNQLNRTKRRYWLYSTSSGIAVIEQR